MFLLFNNDAVLKISWRKSNADADENAEEEKAEDEKSDIVGVDDDEEENDSEVRCKIFLGFTSNMISSGTRGFFFFF